MKRNIIFTFILLIILFLSGIFIYCRCNPQTSILEKELTTFDGTRITINEIKTGHKEVLIIAPGWFMCKDSIPFDNMAKRFSKSFDVITMSFRGHCGSGGKFTFTSREYDDLNTVINFARKDYKKVYVAGFSLGSATAVITQYKYQNADKLILVSPPVDFDRIENRVWSRHAYIPTLKKFEVKTWTNITPGKFWLKKIKPLDVIDKISPTPILIIAGTHDPIIRLWHAEELYQKAKEPKKIIVYGKSRHAEDIFLENKEKFIKDCITWLKKTPD